MTANMKLVRKSDGLILSDLVVDWADWSPLYTHIEHRTQAGTYYPQSLGYASEVQEITVLVASHYANSTPARFRAIWQAHRRNHTLRFTDSYGDAHDVRLFEIPGRDSGERWKEVPTKTIVRRKLVLLKLDWYT